MLAHGGFGYERVIRQMYMSTEGVFGIAVGVSATYLYLFILFGAFLQKSGTTTFFTNLAFAAAGHSPGGPAKVGVLASGLMGMIQGSSAANVAATGVFTIPLMKSRGFRGYFAAAVEAVASCGGQFLPPVMGASAFIMAEYLQMPYAYIAAGAVLPAALYYGAVYFQIHLRARKVGMEGLPRHRLPRVKSVILGHGHLVLPVFLLVGMLVLGFTALYAAFFSILAVLAISSLRAHTRMSLADVRDAGPRRAQLDLDRDRLRGGRLHRRQRRPVRHRPPVHPADHRPVRRRAAAGAAARGGSVAVPELRAATTSVYIITATLVAPSLVQLGVAPLVAHLFCYYWGGVSAITPPVALAAYVAAGIADASVMKSGFTAMLLGMAAYLVPFIFVYWPALVLWHEASPLRVMLAILGGAVAVFCMGGIGERYLTRPLCWPKVALLAIAIVLVLHPANIANLVAVAIVLFVGGTEYAAARRPAPAGA